MHRSDGQQKLHIAAVAEIPLGREMAHAINAFKTAGGFARLGHRVTVFCMPPARGDIASALAMYGEPGLEVRTIDPPHGASADEASRSFSRSAVELAAGLGCDLIYARNFYAGIYGPEAGVPTVIETHAHVGDANPLLEAVFAATRDAHRPLRAIVTIAPALREHYIARGAAASRVHIVPDAADPALFDRPEELPSDPSPSAASAGGARAVYSGHLYEYKGVPAILGAARIAPEIEWHLLGGTREDVERVRAQAAGLANVRVLGRVPHAEVPPYLWHADVLVLPPSADHASARWTSPVKLAEYLWAGRPIAASGIEGLRNWVDEPAVAWFEPGDAASLASCVRTQLTESVDQRRERTRAQRALAGRFTYANRAQRIIDAARTAQ